MWSANGDGAQEARARLEGDELVIETAGHRHRAFVGRASGVAAGTAEVALGPETFEFHVMRGAGTGRAGGPGAAAGPQPIATPMPGRVQAVHVKPGQDVRKGELLVTLEAMKMQNEFLSPADGRVTEVRVAPGAVAGAGDVLVVIAPTGHA